MNQAQAPAPVSDARSPVRHMAESDPAAEPDAGQDRGMLEWARLRPHDGFVIGAVLRLRGPAPTPGRVAALVRARLPQLPVLAEHLDGPARREHWRRADAFDAAQHVHRIDGPADPAHCAELMANQPVPADRPRWGLWLIDTGRHDEYLLAYRVHHAAQDGAAVAHTISRLLDARAPAVPAGDSPTSGRGASTPPRSDSRLLAAAGVPADALRAVSRASGASLNDVYLAALAGALRNWLAPAQRDQPVPVRVPFSLRLRHERQDRGNRIGYTRVLLPVDDPAAERRLARVAEQTNCLPRDRTRRLLERMPPELMWEHTSTVVSPGDALASATLLGIPTPLAFDNSPVTGGLALPPLADGHLFSTVLFLHGGHATFCATAQTRHQHVRDLPGLWAREVRELAATTHP
ncbi:wax ester/triacylglycerol synthase domain-containing protein [Kitasatospora sp. GAS1066B]|uniref:wax ester/triacylglycerol synthase domain-containing protein n=1 Tax=Kitasatospora sp. GAS1066B TaxID=3156271 RepID=UPI0035183E5D